MIIIKNIIFIICIIQAFGLIIIVPNFHFIKAKLRELKYKRKKKKKNGNIS